MKHATKGILLSGLVLPGLGQVALKRPIKGFIFLTTALVSLGILLASVYRIANEILAKTLLKNEIPSMDALTTNITQALYQSSGPTANIALNLILLCWFASIVDAYFIGKKLDSEADSSH